MRERRDGAVAWSCISRRCPAAAAAQTVGLLSNRTTGTTPVLVLGKCGNENRMH